MVDKIESELKEYKPAKESKDVNYYKGKGFSLMDVILPNSSSFAGLGLIYFGVNIQNQYVKDAGFLLAGIGIGYAISNVLKHLQFKKVSKEESSELEKKLEE